MNISYCQIFLCTCLIYTLHLSPQKELQWASNDTFASSSYKKCHTYLWGPRNYKLNFEWAWAKSTKYQLNRSVAFYGCLRFQNGSDLKSWQNLDELKSLGITAPFKWENLKAHILFLTLYLNSICISKFI